MTCWGNVKKKKKTVWTLFWQKVSFDLYDTGQHLKGVLPGGFLGWTYTSHSVLYLYVAVIVAAVFISAALALVSDLRLGAVVFWRWHRVGSFGNFHRFSVNCIGHSHCKVLLGDAGKYREPERDRNVHEGMSMLRWEASRNGVLHYYNVMSFI